MKEFKIEQRTLIGVMIILVGVVLFLNSVGVIDADISIGTFWPLILIVFGVVKIINFDESSFFGGILLLIGVFFQLRNLDVPFVRDANFSNIFWPGLIILFGISMIMPEKSKHRNNDGDL